MKDLPAWEIVWIRVSRCLAEVAGKVAKACPVAWSSINKTPSDIYPFNATASFGRSGEQASAVEDAVVSVSGYVKGDTLVMSADVARGDGYVLVDGPTFEVPVSEAKQNLERDLEPWLVTLEAFLLQEAHQHIVLELSLTRDN